MRSMRLFFTFSILSFCIQANAQNCKSNIDIKVMVCGSNFQKDSTCPACYECRSRLVASDTSFSILSFRVTAGGEGFDGDIYEAPNEGAFFTAPVRNILVRLRKGSFIEFSCIKAKHRNGNIYTLQPFFLELK